MERSCLRHISLALLALTTVAIGQTIQMAEPSQQLLQRLPEDWRATIASVQLTSDQENRYLTMTDLQVQVTLLAWLARFPDKQDFVLDHMEKLQSPKDEAGLSRMIMFFDHWAKNPRVTGVLNKWSTGKDPDLAMAALETLKTFTAERERALVEQQLASAEGETREKLAIQDEFLMDTEKGTVVPSYMRRTPAVFAAMPASSSIRVLGFGDFGTGRPEQKQVADAMVKYHQQHRFDFGITMGDNFTPIGMAAPDDPRWQSKWEDLYGPMKIKFYPSFGNHDWGSPESPAAELSYKSKAGNWIMPAPYYTYTAGPAQFFAIDTGVTGAMSLAQLQWLKAELEKSQVRWKIVYGHHPAYFALPAGWDDNPTVTQGLFPVLRGRADVYIAGHFHSLQHIKPVDGVNLYISAGGGRPLYPLDENSPRALYAKSVFGFSVLEIDDHNFTVKFVGIDNQILDESIVHK